VHTLRGRSDLPYLDDDLPRPNVGELDSNRADAERQAREVQERDSSAKLDLPVGRAG